MSTKHTSENKDSFYKEVFAIVQLIPEGRVTSYGAIARCIPSATARMIGWAMNRAINEVPAHRVVNSKGFLSGRLAFATPTLMQELLESEGLTIKKDKVQNFKQVYWDPSEELTE